MEHLFRCLILSIMTGISCQLFYETIIPHRKWRQKWIEYTAIPAFAAVFLVISFAKVPPFILRPVRIILVTAVIAQIYFQIHIVKNLILSVLFCGIYWGISTAVLSVFSLYTDFSYEITRQLLENLTEVFHLSLIMAFHCRYKSRIRNLTELHWKKIGIFPVLFLITVLAINMIPNNPTATDNYARFTTISGVAILSIFLFYYVMRTLEKEEALQKLQLRTEHARNQMAMYHTMQNHYEQQRRFLHDYKNQLNCIQGLLDNGKTDEASAYISRITGNLRTQFGDINTNHTIVNIILNQKYQIACDKNITMTFVINDLSELTMPEEDLVTLLTNLLDNAIEACEKLDPSNMSIDRIIQFKMIWETGQLVLSIRNPVSSPVRIKNNTIVTSKKDSIQHGIGLSNVDFVIKKYGGTSIIACENGWFSFSAIV
mgnify:FL=1